MASLAAAAVIAGAFVTLSDTVLPVSSAQAAPGTPGVPGDPVPVFQEAFELGQGATATRLADYVGVAGQTHTADSFWLREDQCNGVLLQYADTVFPGASPEGGFCVDGNQTNVRNNVRRLADVLGQIHAGVVGSASTATPVNGSTADTRMNTAVTAFTSDQNGPNGAIQFQTSPLGLGVSGTRFYATSVDVAELSCEHLGGANNSRLRFSLMVGGTETPFPTSEPIRACTDPRARYYTSPDLPGGWVFGGGFVAAGRFTSDSSLLLTAEQINGVQIIMRNEVGAQAGNDAAFDNIRLLDVTPQLDKAFSPAEVTVGETSTLTLTVTNTSELAAKDGWSFTDQLPSGLVVQDPANTGGTCDAVVTAPAGGTSLAVTAGKLAAGQVSCTITVDVTSTTAGDYENCAANIVDPIGMNLPDCAAVTFLPPAPALSLTKAPTPTVITGPGDLVTYSFEVTNISDVRIESIVVTDVQHAPAGALTSGPTCPLAALDPEETMVCTATYVATDEDVEHGRIDDTATAAGVTDDGDDVFSNEADATVLVEPVLDWTLVKGAFRNGVKLPEGGQVSPGDVITYRVTATSAATVRIDGITLTDDLSAVLDDAAFVAGSGELVIDGNPPVAVPDPAGDVLTAGPFSLPAGASAILSYQVTVNADAWSRTLTNAVTGTAGTPEEPIDPEPCIEECTTTHFTPPVLRIQKVGEDTNGDIVPMDGSAWAIYDAADAVTPVVGPVPAAEDAGVPVTGLFQESTLAAGSYWLEETAALPGFQLLAQRVPFTIDADGAVALSAPASANVTVVSIDGIDTIRVEDVPALALPGAGGPGTTWIHLIGMLLILSGAIAGTLILARERRTSRAVAAHDPSA